MSGRFCSHCSSGARATADVSAVQAGRAMLETMSPTSSRPYDTEDCARVVELSLLAWAPVFDSFHAMLGDDLYRRVHPDWLTDQAASVRDALERNDTWVSVTDDTVSGFVN